MSTPADSLTILRSRDARLAKMIDATGTVHSYEGAYTYDGFEFEVANLQDLRWRLDQLLPRPDCAVIRGALNGGEFVSGVRRLLHTQKNGTEPTLHHVTHHWLALDFDNVDRPDSVDAADVTACAECAIALLPACFHDAQCIAVVSGSHGFKPGIRIRLWYWLARPMGTLELKRWLRQAPIDCSLFSPAQLTYTAAPVLWPGCIDPIPQRLVELPGDEFVWPPTAEDLAPAVEVRPDQDDQVFNTDSNNKTDRYVTGALVRAVANIVAAQVGRRHVSIVREACGLARYVEIGCLTEREVTDSLTWAAKRANKNDPDEIAKAIAWGLSNPNIQPIKSSFRRAS